MLKLAPSALLDHYLGISRLLAGQMDFRSAIRAVAAEISHIVPHDHLDVCIMTHAGKYLTAYETGLETEWGRHPPALVSSSPIRSLLWGEVGYLISENALVDPRFSFEGAFSRPIFEQALRSRIHVPLKVEGDVIGALSCSAHAPGFYTLDDVANARSIADLMSPYFFALRAAAQLQESAIVQAEARAREEGLRQGALKLTEALESERQRIGMDLHDQTLADLTRLSRRLERLTHQPDVPGETLEPLARSLQHCMQDLRQIIEEAKPSVLQLFGFAQAIENHLDRSIRESGLVMTQRLVDDTGGIIDSLDPTVCIALFRITQEAINNAVRHAQATHISVALTGGPERISIEVRDDGIGVAKTEHCTGTGIDNMKTRARLISAQFSILGDRGAGGTVVGIHLPLVPAAERQLEVDR